MEPCIATWWISYFPICIAMPLIITEANTMYNEVLEYADFQDCSNFPKYCTVFICERFVALGHTHHLKDHPGDNEDIHVL